jgi:hypothetical protein
MHARDTCNRKHAIRSGPMLIALYLILIAGGLSQYGFKHQAPCSSVAAFRRDAPPSNPLPDIPGVHHAFAVAFGTGSHLQGSLLRCADHWRYPYHPDPEVSLLSGYAVPSLGVGLAGLFNLTGLDLHYSDCYGPCDLPLRP